MKRRKAPDPMEKARAMSQLASGKTDPNGSWTGQPLDPEDKPIQDADDL